MLQIVAENPPAINILPLQTAIQILIQTKIAYPNKLISHPTHPRQRVPPHHQPAPRSQQQPRNTAAAARVRATHQGAAGARSILRLLCATTRELSGILLAAGQDEGKGNQTALEFIEYRDK